MHTQVRRWWAPVHFHRLLRDLIELLVLPRTDVRIHDQSYFPLSLWGFHFSTEVPWVVASRDPWLWFAAVLVFETQLLATFADKAAKTVSAQRDSLVLALQKDG